MTASRDISDASKDDERKNAGAEPAQTTIPDKFEENRKYNAGN